MSSTSNERPKSSSLTDVQDWVVSSLKYKGRRAVAARQIAENAMDWWSSKPHVYRQVDKEEALAACRASVKERYSQHGSILASLILSIVLNLIARAVTELIIDWLFSENLEESQ